jgi:hypothetical protein
LQPASSTGSTGRSTSSASPTRGQAIAAARLLPDEASADETAAYVEYLRLQLQGPLTEALLELLETIYLDHRFEDWKARGGVP